MTTTTASESARKARVDWEQALEQLRDAAHEWGAHLESLAVKRTLTEGALTRTPGLTVQVRALNAMAHYHAATRAYRAAKTAPGAGA